MLIVNEYESIPGLHVKVVDVGPQVIPSAGFPAPPGAASTALATMTASRVPSPIFRWLLTRPPLVHEPKEDPPAAEMHRAVASSSGGPD